MPGPQAAPGIIETSFRLGREKIDCPITGGLDNNSGTSATNAAAAADNYGFLLSYFFINFKYDQLPAFLRRKW